MKKGKKTFIVAQKISRHMFKIYLLLYLLILLLIAVLIIPLMFFSSYKNCINTVNDIASNYEELQSQMISAASGLRYSEIIEEKLFDTTYTSESLKESRLQLDLESVLDKNSHILAISLVTGDGKEYYPIFSYKYDLSTLLNANPDYVSILKHNHSSYFGPLLKDVFGTATMPYSAFSYSVTSKIRENNYTLTIFYNANSYMKVNERFLERSMDSCTVFDRNGHIMCLTEPGIPELSPNDNFYRTAISGTKFTPKGIYFFSTVTSSGWKVISFASYLTLLRGAILILLAITVLSSIAPITYIHYLNRAVSDELSPILELSDIMSNFRIGQNVHSDIRTEDEIQDICQSFNSMVSTINGQAVEIRQQEKQNALVSYKLLVTQVDPHFIYNTMNIINIMARNGNDSAVIEINSALIKILRERLSAKLSVMNTIEEEIDTLEQYNLIMRYRFGEQIHVFVSVPTDIHQIMIPKNIIQPLVENAFYHGIDINDPDNSLNVDVMVYLEGSSIVIEVTDDGIGMTKERLEQIQSNSSELYSDSKPHIGIDNIRQRLTYLYGDRASMKIESARNTGTNVVITLPSQIDKDIDFI